MGKIRCLLCGTDITKAGFKASAPSNWQELNAWKSATPSFPAASWAPIEALLKAKLSQPALQKKMLNHRLCLAHFDANDVEDNHQFFTSRILDPEILKIFLNQEQELKHKKPSPTPDNRQLRYAAYRSFTYWLYGKLTGGERVEVPLCVLGAVRQAFPDPAGRYTGFQPYVELDTDPDPL